MSIHRFVSLSSIALVGSCAAMLALAGCGSGPKAYPVEGTVKYKDGTPMTAGGLIIFNPMDTQVKVTAQGEIKEDGTFKLGTFAETDGAPVGKYRVLIALPPLANPNRPPAGWPPINVKYSSADKSGLEFTVTAIAKNEYAIVVEK